MGKVTYTGPDSYNQTCLYTPPHTQNVTEGQTKEDDSESLTEDNQQDETQLEKMKRKKKKEKEEMMNNNDQPLEVAT